MDQRRQLVTDGEGIKYVRNIYVPCTNYLNLHPQITQKFTLQDFPDFYLQDSDGELCTDVQEINLYILTTQQQINCEFSRFRVQLQCSEQQNVNILPLEIDQQQLQEFTVPQEDGEDGENANQDGEQIIYADLNDSAIIYDTQIKPIFQNIDFYLRNINNGSMQNIQFLNYTDEYVYVRDVENFTIQNSYFNISDHGTAYLYMRGFQRAIINECLFYEPEEYETISSFTGYFIYGYYLDIFNTTFLNNKSNRSGSAFYSYYVDYLNVTDSRFSGHTSTYSSAIIIVYPKTSFFDRCIFDNNIVDGDAAGIKIMGSQDYIKVYNSSFYDNIAYGSYGGAIYVEMSDTYIEILNNKFENNKGWNAGIAFLNDTQSLLVDNCTFINNEGQVGGVFLIEKIPQITMKNLIMTNNFCDNKQTETGEVGAILIDNNELVNPEKTKILLKNITFTGNKAHDSGAVEIRNVMDGEEFLLEDLNFKDNQVISLSSGAIKLDNIKIPSYLQNITMDGNSAYIHGGSIVLEDVQNCTLQDIDIYNSMSGQNGGSLYFLGKTYFINVNNVQIFNSSGLQGGAIKIEQGNDIYFKDILIQGGYANMGMFTIDQAVNINLDNIKIQDSQAFQVGGLSFLQANDILCQNIQILNCQASDSYGGVYVFNSYKIELQDFIIQNNTAALSSGGLSVINSYNNTFSNIQIIENIAYDNGGGVSIQNSYDLIFLNINALNNYAERSGGGFVLKYAINITFQNIIVNKNTAKLKTGGGFSMDSCENINFQNVTVNENIGMIGGGLYIISQNNIDFKDIQINNNQAGVNGGGLYIVESLDIQLLNAIISFNYAQQSGGGITLIQVNTLTIQEFEINKNIAKDNSGGGVYIYDRSENIQFQNGQIQNNNSTQLGGGLYIDHIVNSFFKGIDFLNNHAIEEGGSIYVEYSEDIEIKKCKFQDHLQDIQYASCFGSFNLDNLIIEDSEFTNNQALLQGGAIKIEQSQNILIQNNNFYNNKVIEDDISEGGTFYLKTIQSFTLFNNFINKSQAYKYGGGMYAYNIINTNITDNQFKLNTVYFDTKLSTNQKLSTYKITQGGNIYYESKDLIENEYLDIEQLQLITINNNTLSGGQASSGGVAMFNFNFKQDVQYKIENNTFKENIADIGSVIRFLDITQNNQRILPVQNNEFIKNQGYIVEDDIFYGYFTNEKLIFENYAQFELCEQGQNLKEGGQLLCDQCNVNGVCEGGYIMMYPKEEFWRFDKNDEVFYHCDRNPQACLGNDTCLDGHIGLLCERCDIINNYSSSGDDCRECAPQANLWLNLCFLFLFTCFLLGNQIYGLSSRIKRKMLQKSISHLYDLCFQKVGQLSGVTKIFLMHCQILYLVATYNIEFPYEVTSSIQVIGNQQKMFSNSLNCLLPAENNEDIKKMDYYLAYYGLALTIGCLIILLFFELLIYLQKKIIKQKEQLYGYFKGSIICFFLMVQPGLLQNSLQFVVCRDVGGQSFNSADSNIKCDEDLFTKEILPINICVILLLGFIIPIILGVSLYKYKIKNLLWRVNVQRSAGILYLEVKDQYYFWEIVAIIIKIIVVIISITFNQEVVIKGCLCAIILIVYLVVCYKLKPFATTQLNNLSVFATMTQTLSIILVMCLYELEEKQIENWQTISWIPILIMISLNIVFVSMVGYLILIEFEWIFRYTYLSYIKVDSRIKKFIEKRINRERKAKKLWRLIKIGIHHSTLAKRRIKQDYGGIEINKEEIFYLYVKNSIRHPEVTTYLDRPDMDHMLQFMPTYDKIDQTFPSQQISKHNQHKLSQSKYNKQVSIKKVQCLSSKLSQFQDEQTEIKNSALPTQQSATIQKKKNSSISKKPSVSYNNPQKSSFDTRNDINILKSDINLNISSNQQLNSQPLNEFKNINVPDISGVFDLSSNNISRQELIGQTNRSLFAMQSAKQQVQQSFNDGDDHQEIIFDNDFPSDNQIEQPEINIRREKIHTNGNKYKDGMIVERSDSDENEKKKENVNNDQNYEKEKVKNNGYLKK